MMILAISGYAFNSMQISIGKVIRCRKTEQKPRTESPHKQKPASEIWQTISLHRLKSIYDNTGRRDIQYAHPPWRWPATFSIKFIANPTCSAGQKHHPVSSKRVSMAQKRYIARYRNHSLIWKKSTGVCTASVLSVSTLALSPLPNILGKHGNYSDSNIQDSVSFRTD